MVWLTLIITKSVYRYVIIRGQENSYLYVAYSVEDPRRPHVRGRVRVDALAATLVRELEGSEGNRSECIRMSRIDPKVRGFGGGGGGGGSLSAS